MDPNTLALMMGAAGAAAGPATYVEDVFQTWLYTGNSSTQTITNGVDLAGKGGMVWLKDRDAANVAGIYDTVRGVSQRIVPSATNAQATTSSAGVNQFNSDGFQLASGLYNQATEVSWTFRKQAKFFDVVTWVGNGSNQTISHSLGSAPGVIIAKRTDAAGDWYVYHRSLATASENFLVLNSTAAANGSVGADIWAPTSTTFKASTTLALSNSSATYVAYLFAHDAGGFGATGNDSVIKCGSFTTDGSGNATVDLGWEPQWVLMKKYNATGQSWILLDSMRGIPVSGNSAYLLPNSSSPEYADFGPLVAPNATGFTSTISGESSSSYIYIAIRRGPMKTPTDATKVFYADAGTNATGATVTTSFPVDLVIQQFRAYATSHFVYDRLRSLSSTTTEAGKALFTNGSAAESDDPNTRNWSNTGYQVPSAFANESRIFWNFRRAPGFFDVVAYAGTGSTLSVSHNLQVAPELAILKSRSLAYYWLIYHKTLGNTSNFYNFDTGAAGNYGMFAGSPTSTTITIAAQGDINSNGSKNIAYLFASCPGVSKVGSYTGTGTTLSIDCGFTAGARFVLIKRADSTGDWYVWDTARGIVSGNDPYLLLNSTAAEDTSTDYIDPLNAGFQISSTAPAAINANGGTFIYLAVA